MVLGPAKKILDGLATSSRIFASRRKAVVATPQGTHLFDAARSTLTRLSGESLEVIAVDAQQRWATLKGAGSLFRLDVVQGTIESVQAPRFTSLVSDRAMTIFVGDDGVLHALAAGETVTLSLQTVGDGTVSVGQRLDEVRGWRTVVAFSSQGVWEIPVDFGGWVAGAGSSVVAGSVPGRVATFGPWIAGQGRSLTWADLATHSTIPVATGMDDYDLWRNVVTFVEGATLAALDIDTGAVSPLLSGVAPAVGVAQRAMDLALDYSRTRLSFGAPIGKLEGIQFKLADMEMKLQACRSQLAYSAALVDQGIYDTLVGSCTKCFVSEAVLDICLQAQQIFGGYGYSKEYPLEKLVRDARIYSIYEGSSEIQRYIIGKTLVGKL